MTEFKSQICTTVEQSKRLLGLGLKKETADMKYVGFCRNEDGSTLLQKTPICKGVITENNIDLPAWSLHRLVSTLTNNGIIITFIDNIVIIERYKAFQKSYEFWDDVYDNIVDSIEWLIKEGYFNKEYLEK